MIADQSAAIEAKKAAAAVRVQTFGGFQVWLGDVPVSTKAWGRDKTLQLFQFFITARQRKALHKEQIIDRLWNEDGDTGDQSFKVALHGINKVLEPDRKSHADMRYIVRLGQTYGLRPDDIWIDTDAFETYIAWGNQALHQHPADAITAYREAAQLYKGIYLPDRIYEDWSSDERERLQVLALDALVNLAELLLAENPSESIRLTQQVLLIDAAWEDAYRIQIDAYFRKGNRPMALKTYQQCVNVLEEEMGVVPLPATKQLVKQILEA
jgi:DNA-binding SARP family transcriptional activator